MERTRLILIPILLGNPHEFKVSSLRFPMRKDDFESSSL